MNLWKIYVFCVQVVTLNTTNAYNKLKELMIMKINTSFRIPEEIKEQLQEVARKQNRSLSNLMILILKEYLENKKDS